MRAYTEIERKYYKYTYSTWTQPVLTSNTSSVVFTFYDPCLSGSTISTPDSPSWGSSSVSNFSSIYTSMDSDSSNYWTVNSGNQTYTVFDLEFDSYLKITQIYIAGNVVPGYASAMTGTIIYDMTSRTPVLMSYSTAAQTNTHTYNGYIAKKIRICIRPNADGVNYPSRITNITITATEKGITESTASDYDYYEDIVDVCKVVKKNERKYYKYVDTGEIDGTISGSLTNNSGILSGFSTSNYVNLPSVLDVSSGQTWEFGTKVVIGSQQSTQSTVLGIGGVPCGGIWIAWNKQSSKVFDFAISSETQNWDIAAHIAGSTTYETGDTVWLKCVFDGSSYKLYTKTNENDVWTQEISVTSGTSTSAYTQFIGMCQSGGSTNTYAWVDGSIDMSNTYINIDGTEWWHGTVIETQESDATDYDYYEDVDTCYGFI